MPYAARYGIAGPRLATMLRGTLRYRGFCAALHALAAAGLLGTVPRPAVRGASLRAWLAAAVGASESDDDDAIIAALAAVADASASAAVDAHAAALAAAGAGAAAVAAARAAAAACSNAGLAADPAAGGARLAALRGVLEWAGLLRADTVAPLRGGDCGDGVLGPRTEDAVAAEVAAGTFPPAAPALVSHVPLDTLVALLAARPEMSYGAGERDLALMQHTVEADMGPGRGLERHEATLVEYGRPAGGPGGGTAMARTVGLTAAIGAQLLLDGRVPGAVGVQCPTSREWYLPMLDALEAEGIAFKHSVTRLRGPAGSGGDGERRPGGSSAATPAPPLA